MTDSHSLLGPRCPGRPAIASCTSVPRLTATSAALGKADFELRLYRHRDRRCDSPRRRVALLFQCSFPLGIPSSPSVMLSKNSQRSRSNLSTPLRKLRGTSASCSCRRKETLKKLHYWATDSTSPVRSGKYKNYACAFISSLEILSRIWLSRSCHRLPHGVHIYTISGPVMQLFQCLLPTARTTG